MFTARFSLAVLVLTGLLSSLPAAAPPPGPLPSQLARWVEEMGDDSFAVRQEASQKLRAAGEAAETTLEKAAEHRDAEIARRAKTILGDFRWGIYPDTPQAVVDLIQTYKTTDRGSKGDIIRKLLATGIQGCRALRKIARNETDAQVRKEVFTDISKNVGRVAGKLLRDNPAVLESMLDLSLAGDVNSGAPNYAAFHLLRGTLPAKIAEWEQQRKKVVGAAKSEYEVLAYLYRANGQLDQAVKAATEAERNDLVEAFLFENADWKTLDKRPDLTDPNDLARALGYRAAYARLAGNKKIYDAAVADLLKKAQAVAAERGYTLPYAKALFLNGRPKEAIEMLIKGDYPRKKIYEILVARMEYKQAFTLVDEARKTGSTELPGLEILQARTLHLLGDTAKAEATLKKYAEQVSKDKEASWYIDLIDTELKIGRIDQAFAIAAKVLANTMVPTFPEQVFNKLFERKADDAGLLWLLIKRIHRSEDEEKRINRVRTFMTGKATGKEVETFLAEVKTALKNDKPEENAEFWRVVGEVAMRCKQPTRATEPFKLANTVASLIRLGDLLAEKKQDKLAAEQYFAAYKRSLELTAAIVPNEDSDNLPALALFLSGNALVKAGDATEGKRRIDLAHLLPMGDGEMRFVFSRALVRREYLAASSKEHLLLRRTGEPILSQPNSFYTGEGLRGGAIEAADRKEYLKAATGFEQAFLRLLHPDMSFSRAQAYVLVPSFIHLNRARGLVQAKRFDELKPEIDLINAYVPGHLDMALNLIPKLDQNGRKQLADELFRTTLQPHEELIKTYPQCAWGYNQAAWLIACTHRDLDKGVNYARKAVTLSPKSAAYYDTLAEVLFQSGKKDEAVTAQKKAIALSPERTYFKKQLQRIEAGNPKKPRPEDD